VHNVFEQPNLAPGFFVEVGGTLSVVEVSTLLCDTLGCFCSVVFDTVAVVLSEQTQNDNSHYCNRDLFLSHVSRGSMQSAILFDNFCPSVCLSIFPSNAGTVTKRMHIFRTC